MNKILKENDTYFLQVVKDKIIINDNYEGIIIYDDNLNVVSKIKTFLL